MTSVNIEDSSPLFLGLDLSTQGLKAVLITEDSDVVHESSVNFDRDLPHYGTTNGAIRGPGVGEVTSPVLMWLEGFDLIMEKVKAAGVNFSRILGVSGDGQVGNHGWTLWLPSLIVVHLSPSHSNMAQSIGPRTPSPCWLRLIPLSPFSNYLLRRSRFPTPPFGKILPRLGSVASWKPLLVVPKLSQT